MVAERVVIIFNFVVASWLFVCRLEITFVNLSKIVLLSGETEVFLIQCINDHLSSNQRQEMGRYSRQPKGPRSLERDCCK